MGCGAGALSASTNHWSLGAASPAVPERTEPKAASGAGAGAKRKTRRRGGRATLAERSWMRSSSSTRWSTSSSEVTEMRESRSSWGSWYLRDGLGAPGAKSAGAALASAATRAAKEAAARGKDTMRVSPPT
uniref:Uncharacterized protein n=1 Tax=Zea mays TaxID=4577 RepID=C4J4Y3_MAIZE|nr:unknown [Zea mays]